MLVITGFAFSSATSYFFRGGIYDRASTVLVKRPLAIASYAMLANVRGVLLWLVVTWCATTALAAFGVTTSGTRMTVDSGGGLVTVSE